MDWWLASFFIGAIFSLFLPVVPDLFVLFSLLLLSVIFFYHKPLRFSSGLLLGMSWMLFNAFHFQWQWQDNGLDAVKLSAKKQFITAKVTSLHSVQKFNDIDLAKKTPVKERLRFNVRVTHLNGQKLQTTIKLRLTWKAPSFTLLQGQVVQLKVKFKPAHGLANIGGFSYQTWLNSKSISGTGYVVNHKQNALLETSQTIRQQLYNQYQTLLPKNELAPLLLALGFGSRDELTKELWQVLKATGIGHLIAISGLHIGLVATGSYIFIMLLIGGLPLKLLLSGNKFQVINSRYLAIGLSMVAALSYGYLAGFSLPTTRALLMLTIYWCTRLLSIKLSIKRWLLITLFILTLVAPFSLFTASFWLSVYAVVIIFLSLWRFKHFISSGRQSWRFVKGLLIIQLSLTMMLLPISAVFFQQISIVAFFANIIAVPWMSFLTIPLCLLSVLLMPISESLSQACIWLCIESLQVIWNYLNYLSTLPWTIIELSGFITQLSVLVGVLCIIGLFCQPRINFNKKARVAVLYSAMLCLCLLIIGWSNTDQPSLYESKASEPVNSKNDWQLVVFDVGQGLSILVKHQQKAMLYDTGASYDSGFNMVDAVVLPYLQHAGIKRLDKVIISHSDNDHAGGLAVLQQSIPITEIIYNDDKLGDSQCKQGKNFHWQGLTFEMLWPNKHVAKENDESCVVLISDGLHKVLLTGDISKKIETILMQLYPTLIADVLIVPHHGSKTSSSAEFIAQLKPKVAVVSAGFLNRWRMPVDEVTKRYHQYNVPLLNSAESGQIIFNFSEKGMFTQTYHNELWPFWFAK